MYVSSCFQLLTLSSTSGRWTHVSGEKWWNNADMVGKKWSVFKKTWTNTTFPTTSLTATDLELSNFQTSITDLDLEISTSQSFSNLTYSHPPGSNYKHNHRLFISICQHKSEDVKLYCCHCEVLSQHRRQNSNTETICHLTYHRFSTTISSNKANTTAAQIIMY